MTLHRIRNLREQFSTAGIDGLLVSSMSNIRYLTGFASDERDVATVLIGATEAFLLTDYRFGEQAREQCGEVQIIVRDRARQTLGQLVRELAAQCDIRQLGYERDHFLHGRWLNLAADLDTIAVKPLRGLVEKLRRRKEPAELESMRRAAAIGDRALEQLLGLLQPGITEREAAVELECLLKRAGSEGLAFPTIFTSGARTSRPHGMPSDRVLSRGDLITIDFGAIVDGYRSDMTRTFVLGKADSKQREIYELVRRAQALGVESLRTGIPYSQPNATVNRFLAACPYAEYAGDSLGHGLGLDTHEQPYLSTGFEELLEEDHVVTVEPGIYIPGWGGVRIEDDVRLTGSGPELLNNFSRELIEL
ncbi:Xaa-Pro aminopeptidase [Microbulbifer donghaiensis]|uniref:Xaa-Pro aminopeptidase n=1 Tax=Microbulbifer donghaiensis TaxID=494016 RepID=A0A1M4UD40_9GAMM|nr:Xaa-Pro peptidase family protein [Microbulbifer donghaiensis]SHE54702.1 Xaa-Pro aminopeptidase [Microbulbifer donghaiensis]